MIDMRKTVAPKSDQLNSDDLIGQSQTIKVTKVSLMSEPDQPIAIYFEGDNGKPYKPCKSMRRVLINVWGIDGTAYVGRSMTLYRDEKVMFGGAAVGGIRISHVSHIDAPVTMALTATRANRKPFTVKPLIIAAPRADTIRDEAEDAAQHGSDALKALWGRLSNEQKLRLKPHMDELKEKAAIADMPEPFVGEDDPSRYLTAG
jgi:hypothetical protein